MNTAFNLKFQDEHPRLSIAVIDSLKRQGYSQSDIARMYGVSRQAVSWHKRHYGGQLSPREMVLEHFPFIMSRDQGNSTAAKRLRDHGEYVATGGRGMSEDKLDRLRAWYRKLHDEGLVVEFDPTLPPIEGISGTFGGWAYRRRRKADQDLLIRVNEYTHLSDQGRMIWRFPPIEP